MKRVYTFTAPAGLILIFNLIIIVSGGDENTTDTITNVPNNTTYIKNEPRKAEGIPANSFRSYPSKFSKILIFVLFWSPLIPFGPFWFLLGPLDLFGLFHNSCAFYITLVGTFRPFMAILGTNIFCKLLSLLTARRSRGP